MFIQDAVNSLDCWTKERPLSSSSDRSVRMWKVSDDSHLVFRGHKASIDNVQYLTPESYISSGQDGSLCVWKETQKMGIDFGFKNKNWSNEITTDVKSNLYYSEYQKKPSVQRNYAHGYEHGSTNGRWISAMASCKMTDFVATGSHDGYLRLWNARAEDRVLNPSAAIPVDGFINSIALSKRIIAVGVGNEHRLGRWWRLNKVKNCVKIFKIPDVTELHRIEDDDSNVLLSANNDTDGYSSDSSGHSDQSSS